MPCHQAPSRRGSASSGGDDPPGPPRGPSRSAPISAARIRLTSPRCSVYATGQVCRASADTAKTISGRRRIPAAASAWPHSTVSAIRLPAVRAIFIAPAGAPAKTENSHPANGGEGEIERGARADGGPPPPGPPPPPPQDPP